MRGLLIVINYNQGLEIEAFLKKVSEYYPKKDIVVVDDGSTDESPEIAQKLQFQILHHKMNCGVGAAIRTGIMYAKKQNYNYVIINSSNGKMCPEELEQIKHPIENGIADYVTGSRWIKGGSSPGLPLFRRLAIPAFSLVLSLFLGHRFTDITCGYRAYLIDWLFSSDIALEQSWLDRYELEYYVHFWACRKKLRILEVPVTIRYDHLGIGRKSKIRPMVDWWKMFRPILFLFIGVKK